MLSHCLIFPLAQEVAGVTQAQHAKFAACTSAGYFAALLCYLLQWQFGVQKAGMNAQKFSHLAFPLQQLPQYLINV